MVYSLCLLWRLFPRAFQAKLLDCVAQYSLEYVTLEHGSALCEDSVAAAIYRCIFLYLLFINKIEPVGVRLNLTPMGGD